jgi:2-polyprenyl-3-methyl-5-hydroxy-6-metoxy-1,4-benzoquinol methylase
VRKEIAYYFGSDMSQLDILELGSGDGNFLMGLQREGHKGELCGIDLVPVPVKNDSIDFIVGDINHLPQLLISSGKRDKKFDIIVAIHVLYHIDNVPLLLESVTQWLREGGVFITTANSNQNLHRISRLFRDALLKIGYSFTPDRRYSTFSADNATETMREYFRFVRHTITETDITITDRQDILDYLESNYENYEIPQSSELRDRLRAYIRDSLEISDKFELIDRRIVSISSGREVIRYDSQA